MHDSRNTVSMRILVAEDEPDITDLYRIALEERNHQVLIARDGEECLKLYREEVQSQNSFWLQEGPVTAGGSKHVVAKEKYEGPHINDDLHQHHNDYLSDSDNSSPSCHIPFDAVVLDYRMPKKDGIEVAKEILKIKSKQRIIFASAYVKESLEDCVKELDQVVELLQKPFEPEILVDTIEDREISTGLEKLMINLRTIQDQNSDPTLDQMRDLLEGLRKIQKGRSF